MIICRVIGHVWATKKESRLEEDTFTFKMKLIPY